MHGNNKPATNKAEAKQITLRSNKLTTECFIATTGKLQKKREIWNGNITEFTYQFDTKGHLLTVKRNGLCVEEYKYNALGQRVEQQREYRGFNDATAGYLQYDEQGKLCRAGDTSFYYDKSGALSERCDYQGVTKYNYGTDTLLDKVILPSRAEIRYECSPSQPINPIKRFRRGTLTAEYIWRDLTRLAVYLDHEHQLEYTFVYNENGVLDTIRITPMPPEKIWKPAPDTDWAAASADWLDSMGTPKKTAKLHALFGNHGGVLDLACGVDQVGTLKLLTDKQGRLVKEIQRDSFGMLLFDSQPELFIPIGFAGGLEDPDTKLIRFGYRDYDPSIGRFTAPDPLGDTGGDHDLYDYCIDDPITMNDPTGLISPLALLAPLALFGIGKGIGLGVGLGGSYLAASATDAAISKRTGKKSNVAMKSMKEITPMVVDMSKVSGIPGRLALGGATNALRTTLALELIDGADKVAKYKKGNATKEEDNLQRHFLKQYLRIPKPSSF